LIVACRKMTHRARVAWRKRNIARKIVPGPVWYKKFGEVGGLGGDVSRNRNAGMA
jgi:hypothetical protein